MTMELALPKYTEIPGVGLFLEQVAKYINEVLSPLGEAELTGSMISNYVKKKLLDNPVKKQYSRDQIAYLIFIAIAKNVLSLEDIRTMIVLQKEKCDAKTAYEYFSTEFASILHAVFDNQNVAVQPSLSASRQLAQKVSIAVAYKVYLDQTFREMKETAG
ncbi:MAG: DUF1836 domain-containing protein [Butyrivibrio sp.]|nr:DUF1836 domain-containing protein [Butyrivibrio sp.]